MAEQQTDDTTAAKRPKLEPVDDDDDIVCLSEPLAQNASGADTHTATSQAETSQSANEDTNEGDLESKLAAFRAKVLEYEEKISQLKSEANRKKHEYDGGQKYLEEERAKERAGRLKAEKECKHLRNENTVRDDKIDNLGKQLLKAEKETADAKKTSEDAKKAAEDAQKEADASKKAQADSAKKAADLDSKLKAAKKQQSDAEKKAADAQRELAEANEKIADLEEQLSDADEGSQPETSTGNNADAKKTIQKLRTQLATSKKKLTALKAQLTKTTNEKRQIQKRLEEKEEEIRRYTAEQQRIRELAHPKSLLDVKVKADRFFQAMTCLSAIDGPLTLKYTEDGLSICNTPPRAKCTSALLVLRPAFFDKYDCPESCIAAINNEIYHKMLLSNNCSKFCSMRRFGRRNITMTFSGGGVNYSATWTAEPNPARLRWSPYAATSDYVCVFEMGLPQLAVAVNNLSPVVFDYDADRRLVSIADSEDRLLSDERKLLWKSYTAGNAASHMHDFQAELTESISSIRIFVDPKYIRPLLKHFQYAEGAKDVQVSLNARNLRLVYGDDKFALTYYIPTVAPDATTGQRCYSPIGCETVD